MIKSTPPYIVFCSVGQGNGAYLRLKNNIDILIDVGSSGAIGACLRKYMPWHDRLINYIFITHSQEDHAGGLTTLSKAYHIGTVFYYCNEKENCIPLKEGNSRLLSSSFGEFLLDGGAKITYFIPFFGLIKSDSNEYSVIYKLKVRHSVILFTGDSTTNGLRKAMYENQDAFKDIDILLVPHHGSRTSVSIPFYRYINPKLAVISVGKGNQYGHPSKYVIETLEKFHIPYKRTDLDGDILINL